MNHMTPNDFYNAASFNTHDIGKFLYDFTHANLHIKYLFAAREISKGAIDCSGWTAETIRSTMRQINSLNKEEVYDITELERSRCFLSSAEQVKNLGEKAGFIPADKIEDAALISGTLIGIARRPAPKWAENRWNQISHVVIFIDHDEQRLISQSADGHGVYLMNYSDWLANEREKQSSLFATNPFKLTKICEP